MVDAQDPRTRPRRRGDQLRPGDHGHDLRRRPHLRRPLQSRRHLRVCRSPATSPGRASPLYWAAQLAGALAAALVLRGSLGNIAHVGATLPSRIRRPGVPVGGGADVLPDVRDHGRRHRHPSGGRGGRDRDRRHRRPGRDVRRPNHRRLDEPRPLARPGHRRAATTPRSGCTCSAAASARPLAAVTYQFLRAEHPRAWPTSRPTGAGGGMSHVLFVCIQNAGRSQIAQALFERAAERRTTRRARPEAARPRTSTPRSSR